MRPPKRGAYGNPLLALSFTLGLVGLLCFTNPTLLSSSSLSHEASEEGGPSRGVFARALLDPGNDSGADAGGTLTDLHEQHQDSLVSGARRGGHVALAAAGQHAAAGRRAKTLVLYVYNALDIEHQKNFDFFLRWGVQEGLTYKFIITEGAGVLDLLTLPPLPPNAEYIKTRACTTTWGAVGAVLGQLPTAKFEYFLVLDSSVKGPFIPTYAQQVLHWTEVFTGKLGSKVKLVGSMISCEGSPKDGNAAGEWRENPYVLPYVWATDKVGWEVLAKEGAVFKCYANPWDTRYYSDSGASLAVLKAGYNLDTLLTRYQGVDWWKQENWGCNERVRPDGEMYYDGVSITPYETVFVPVSLGYVQNSWSFVKTAAKYEEWLTAKANGAPKVNDNAWVSDSMSIKAQQLVYMNARGPGCFDFRFYLQRNPDLANFASDPLELWEHFLLLGQFQGRLHRFSCPVQIGNSYRVAYIKARGHTCFDHNYYVTMAPDLKVLPSSHDLWLHYAGFGQFENRQIRYVCADTFRNLTRGFDEVPMLGAVEATAAGGAQQEAGAAAEGAQQAQQDAGQLEAAQQQQQQASALAEGAAGVVAADVANAAAEAAAAGAQQ